MDTKNSWLTIIITAAVSLSLHAKTRNCYGNHSCKKVFYMSSDYHDDTHEIDKALFTKTVQDLSKQGIIVYHLGDGIKIYIPHKLTFNKKSDNLKSDIDSKIQGLVDLISFYNPQQVVLKGVAVNATPHDTDKPKVNEVDLVRKQTRVLADAMRTQKKLASIEVVTAESTEKDMRLEFWRSQSGKTAKASFTMVEFFNPAQSKESL